ncbi:MAG TPA: hypothetical protein VNT76_20665 [Candidatus Binatus sp.]|nr:hypothetical protein [Candidatus Binatus sp.]
MKIFYLLTSLIGFGTLVLAGCSQVNPYFGSCGKAPNLEVIALNMFPDPLPAARKIDQWRAIVRSDSADLCKTTLAVAIEGQSTPITAERSADLALGANEVLLYTLDDYRLSGDRLCFELTAYINSEKLAVKAPRRFCARTIDRDWWSMR